jgi:glycopeptide antibiotics resistance protein
VKPVQQKQSQAAAITARQVGWAAAALVAVWILSMTLTPGRAANEINLVPFSQKAAAITCLLANCSWHRRALAFLMIDGLGNAAVFVPLGAALAVARRPVIRRQRARPAFGWPLRVALLGGLFSLGIELAQLAVPGRATDVDDVILNTLGTLLGAGLVWFLYPILRGHHD